MCLSGMNTKLIKTGPPLVEIWISGKLIVAELAANLLIELMIRFITCSRGRVLSSMAVRLAPESWLDDWAAIGMSEIVCRCAALAVNLSAEKQTRTLR